MVFLSAVEVVKKISIFSIVMLTENDYLICFPPSGPIQVVDEHFSVVLLNCYDAIGIMLMIRIIHQHQVNFDLLMMEHLAISTFLCLKNKAEDNCVFCSQWL